MKESICCIKGCEKVAAKVKMCSMHYRRVRRYGSPDIVLQPKNLSLHDRFYNAVIVTEGCWDWLKKINSNGYASLFFSGKWIPASRASWMLHIGPIPKGLHVLHTCDNRRCSNPDHLFLGTNTDNVADMVSKGRQYRKYARACLVEGCEFPSRKLGLCTPHYNRQYHANRRLNG